MITPEGKWALGLGDSSPEIRKIKAHMRAMYRSYAGHLADTDLFDEQLRAAVMEMQRRQGVRVTGWIGYSDKVRMRYVIPGPDVVGYAVPGTWGQWNIGPHAMAVNRYPERVYLQGVQYNTSAFINPDPRHSYVEAVGEGVVELLRWTLPEPRRKIISGYSMGAEVVARFLDAWPVERRREIIGVITFGSPSRPPGPTKLGPDPGGAGISGFWTPEWARDREWSYTIDGDMYSEANSPLMTALYDILTRMELSVDFARYLFGVLTSSAGPALLGLAGATIPGFGVLRAIHGLVTEGDETKTDGPPNLFAMMTNLPVIITALIGALKFLFTGAHGKYWVNRQFEGMTAEDHAASVVRRLAA
ncbi:peptidoglycan-binding domain-containing protein [Mycobacterium sp. NPDC050041]|uniref:peptidoglycan-binding domain-containing protein n=1 Tax=Mycobacterium sp. NPDC050041 TaxID=3364293 RepID=UPI003C2C5431